MAKANPYVIDLEEENAAIYMVRPQRVEGDIEVVAPNQPC